MKICLAQTRSVPGRVDVNLQIHLQAIKKGIQQQADLIVFPELSLTGYEPVLAGDLALSLDDPRLDCIQALSDENQTCIGLGAPIKHEEGTSIGMIIFQPHQSRWLYEKKYLHPDEVPFFIEGKKQPKLVIYETTIALAICYELSIKDHLLHAFATGSDLYLASVAKTQQGIEQAQVQLSQTAQQHTCLVLMVNAVGPADGVICAGQSTIWNSDGGKMCQLSSDQEILAMLDTSTNETRIIER
ncbi:MAG: carbon-nitrogen hydrolase family protein [Cyclobacteriaceae bacterium]|nr:carbon-nitrogen hydrolase family protein [Cyclobacteriaceae bacterium HetDA_MAG_MS6]